jgi:hypothetical protein
MAVIGRLKGPAVSSSSDSVVRAYCPAQGEFAQRAQVRETRSLVVTLRPGACGRFEIVSRFRGIHPVLLLMLLKEIIISL